MNKIIFTLIAIIFLNNCSFNENSRIWKNDENKFEKNKNIIKVLNENKKIILEFNQDLKFDLSNLKTNNKITDNQNNFGSQSYGGDLKKIGNFKFSKLDEINKIDYKPIFLKDGIIFFDKKGSIIRYDNNQKVQWRKNYYSKLEKKLKPKLNFFLDGQNLIVADTIAKYYSINLINGELNWLKNNFYPFNSEIKKFKNKIFIVDYKNTLRCYKIEDGSKCWELQTDDSFTISDNKYSLILTNENVIFNNSIGDITAVEIDTGFITWQLPTQNSAIINETYNFKSSKLVSDGNSIFFSNNKNEFYSIDLQSGTINWINQINSNITPILIKDFIFTVSNEGYLYVINKTNGKIIRITDLFKNYKDKKRKKIYPIGFAIDENNIFLTNTDGKMIVVGIDVGNIAKIEKISGGLISKPYIFNNNLYVVRNGSILKYN